MKDRYLGDGVYAKDQGNGTISLDLRAQEATQPITEIVLEIPVMNNLLHFHNDLQEELDQQ